MEICVYSYTKTIDWLYLNGKLGLNKFFHSIQQREEGIAITKR